MALIVAIAVILTLNKGNYEVLVTQVSNNEASTILNFLSEQGVTDYKVEDGNTILVPAGQEAVPKGAILISGLKSLEFVFMDKADINSLYSALRGERSWTVVLVLRLCGRRQGGRRKSRCYQLCGR